MSRESEQRAQRVRRTLAKHGAALVAQVEAGAPLVDVLDALGLARDLAPDLAERSELRAAQARRRAVLRAQLADPDKAKREQAVYLLEVDHGVRRPGTLSIGDRLGALLGRYRDWCGQHGHAEAYNQWVDLLTDAGELAPAAGTQRQTRARRVAS
jgi:hypothetical protein